MATSMSRLKKRTTDSAGNPGTYRRNAAGKTIFVKARAAQPTGVQLGFPDTQSLVDDATKRATAQLQPQLQDNAAQATRDQAASDTRQGELKSWYGWAGDRLKNAFDAANAAANNLIATRSAGTRADQDALAGALRGQTDKQGQLATQLGGAPPPSQDAAVLAGALAQGDSANRGAFDTAQAMTLGAGERVGTAAVGGLEASRQERAQLNAKQQETTAARKSLLAQLPGLISQNTDTNRQFELASQQFGVQKANTLFQQWLAEQQLGDDRSKTTFDQWLSRQNLSLAQGSAAETKRANLASEANTRAGIRAQLQGDAATKGTDAAKLRAQQWDSGAAWLSSYIAPGKGESNPHQKITYAASDVGQAAADGHKITKAEVGQPIVGPDGKPVSKATPYTSRSYGRALQHLTGVLHMSKSDALRLLRNSDNVDFRKKAASELGRLKRRKQGYAGPAY